MAVPTRVATNGVAAQVQTGLNTSHTFNYPSGSSNGDLLVMFVFQWRSSGGAYTISTPSGWTRFDGFNSSSAGDTKHAVMFWRFRSTETSVAVVASSSGYKGAIIVAYEAATVDATNPVCETRLRYDNQSVSSRTTPVIETPADDCAVLFMCGSLLGTTSTVTHTWSGGTEIADTRATVSTASIQVSAAESSEATAGTQVQATVTPSNTAALGWMTATVAIQGSGAGAARKWVLDETGSGTWTPDFTGNVKALCWGAGGGGGAAGSASGNAGGGGGGGALSIRQLAVSNGTGISYSVGAGLTIAAAGVNNGTAGGDTWFKANDSSGCVAKVGGAGTAGQTSNSGNGPGGSGGAAASGFGDETYTGGDGAAGVMNGSSGGGGGAAGTTGDGNDASGGTGGATKLLGGGEGGLGKTAAAANAADWGASPGGGGNGGRRVSFTNSAGGPGMHGRIELYEVLDQTVNGDDSGAFTDTATVAANVPASDAGAFTDAATIKVSSAADSGAFTDTATVDADVFGTDTAAFTAETATVDADVTATDTASFTDTASVSNAVAGGDSAVFTDNARVIVRGTDAALFTDTASVNATVPVTDSASFNDIAGQLQTAGDSASFTDTASIRQNVTDTASFTDNAVLSVTQFGSETASFTEDARVIITAEPDSLTFTESANKVADGVLVGARVYRVPPEDRALTVEADPRTLAVHREDRTVEVVHEDRKRRIPGEDRTLRVEPWEDE